MDWHEEIKCVHVFREDRKIQIFIIFEENFLEQNPAELGTYCMILYDIVRYCMILYDIV